MPKIPPECNLESYAFSLPQELIAQRPAARRDQSRLLVLEKATGATTLATFADVPNFLPPNCLLVANNSRVVPARLAGAKPTGGRVEFLLLTPLPLVEARQGADGVCSAVVEGLAKSSKPLRPGDKVAFGKDLSLLALEKQDYGRVRGALSWEGEPSRLAALLEELGQVPLPPYIRSGQEDAGDRERYQTTYAAPDKSGSVAAPTAGLHFTPELRQTLLDAGHTWAEVTLHVGYGTFSPVRTEDLRLHEMHAEYVEISPETAQAVNQAKAEGRPVVAVGTTTVRALEGACAAQEDELLEPFAGWVDLFICPGFPFQAVDHLLTNFHLPGSTLLVLVAALAGRENVLAAYEKAVEERMRFYSYGDAMLVV